MNRVLLLVACLAILPTCGSCRGKVPILTWHGVGAAESDFDVTPAQLAAQLDALRAAGYHTVSLHEVLAHEDGGAPLPPKPVVLTFDDGTEDHLSIVLPLLRERGLKATFFVVPAWIAPDAAHRHFEMDVGFARPFLIAAEVRALRDAGMEIGAHGFSHTRLPHLATERVREELSAARRALEATLGERVDLFGYPFNSLRRRHRALVREAGYAAAVAGVKHGNANRFSLYRAPVMLSTTPEQVVALLDGWH